VKHFKNPLLVVKTFMKGALKILDLFGEKPIIVACYEKN
jgi:hypothetical protein